MRPRGPSRPRDGPRQERESRARRRAPWPCGSRRRACRPWGCPAPSVRASGDSLAATERLDDVALGRLAADPREPHGELVAAAVHGLHDVARPKPQHASQVMRLLRVEGHAFAIYRFGADVETAHAAGSRARSDAQPSTTRSRATAKPAVKARPSRAGPRPRGCRRGPARRRGPPAAVLRGEAEMRVGEQIGHDEREAGSGPERLGPAEGDLDAIGAAVSRGVEPCRRDGVGIHVEAEGRRRAELDGGDGEDAGAGADVEALGGARVADESALPRAAARHPSVLPWCPVPKARPGSMMTGSRPPGSPPFASHGGTTSSRSPTASGGNDCCQALAQASSRSGEISGSPGATRKPSVRSEARYAVTALRAAGGRRAVGEEGAKPRRRARGAPPRPRRGRPAPRGSSSGLRRCRARWGRSAARTPSTAEELLHPLDELGRCEPATSFEISRSSSSSSRWRGESCVGTSMNTS